MMNFIFLKGFMYHITTLLMIVLRFMSFRFLYTKHALSFVRYNYSATIKFTFMVTDARP